MRNVPLVEPRSDTIQTPSVPIVNTAWLWDTPGSSGTADRSISGWVPLDTLARPIRTCGGVSTKLRSGHSTGKSIPTRSLASKYARSAVTVAVHYGVGPATAGAPAGAGTF